MFIIYNYIFDVRTSTFRMIVEVMLAVLFKFQNIINNFIIKDK